MIMTNHDDFKDYGDFEQAGTGPLHEVSPRKAKEKTTEKTADSMPR